MKDDGGSGFTANTSRVSLHEKRETTVCGPVLTLAETQCCVITVSVGLGTCLLSYFSRNRKLKVVLHHSLKTTAVSFRLEINSSGL